MLDPVLVADHGLGPGELAAEGDQLAAVGGAEGPPREGEIERLEEVRLAGAVGADEADGPRPQLDARVDQVARRPRFSISAYTLRRIGITR
jgi:hypothetical protein